jgi:hypothetical protein
MLKRNVSKPNKSPTPTSKTKTHVPNLPPEMLREIAKTMSPRNQRVLRAATSKYTRKTLPIGLAVTKVGRPTINITRPPVINRSIAKAKTRTVRSSEEPIDRIIPAAYKNPHWRYYAWLTAKQIIFKNTPTGQSYLINKKTGARRASNVGRIYQRYGLIPNNPLREWGHRTNAHTLNAYYKRAQKSSGYDKGHSVRLNKKQAINNNVELFRHGNRRALNKWTIPNLAWWAGSSYMAINGSPYIKRGGRWYPYGSERPLTKQNILENINAHNYFNN